MERIDYTKKPSEVQRLDARPVETGLDEQGTPYAIVLERDLSQADKDKIVQAQAFGFPIDIVVGGKVERFISNHWNEPPYKEKWKARTFSKEAP